MKDPVVRLRKALYGHPDAHGLWERHLEKGLAEVGFLPIHENWPSVFFHKRLQLFLMVYVDDFKLAGPSLHIAEGWELIKSKVKLDDGGPSPMGLCLGCHRETFDRVSDGHKVKGVRYNMENALLQALEHYKSLCDTHGHKPNLRPVETPFNNTTTLDPDVDAVDEEKGVLASSAASILMKILYTARLPRFDLLKAITSLASRITTWT